MTNEIGETIWQAFEIVEKTHGELISLKKNFRDILEEDLQEYYEGLEAKWIVDKKARNNGLCYYSDIQVDFTNKDWSPDERSLNTVTPFWSLYFDIPKKAKSRLNNIIVHMFTIFFWDDQQVKKNFNGEPQIIISVSYWSNSLPDDSRDDVVYELICSGLKIEDFEHEFEVFGIVPDGFDIIPKPEPEERSRYPEKISCFIRPIVKVKDEKLLKKQLIKPLIDILFPALK